MKPNPAAKRPQDQTNEEWLAEYSYYMEKYNRASDKSESPVQVSSEIVTQIPQNKNTGNTEQSFHYLGHRTTRRGSVAMEFESLDGRIRCTCFFNVRLKSSRGNTYPAKNSGQFNPPEMGSFRRFWMQTIGKPPPSRLESCTQVHEKPFRVFGIHRGDYMRNR